MIKKLICALCLCAVMAAGSACSSEEPSSADASSHEQTGLLPAESAPAAGESRLGRDLQKVADIYRTKKYTLECTLESTELDSPVKIKRVVSGSDSYQLQTEAAGSHGTVTVNGKSYDFDRVCGMYRETDNVPGLNIVEELERLGIAPGAMRDSDREKYSDYNVEQYTYTGDTYITVMDFCFDKFDGHLIKYVTRYSVEGSDDIIETRTIDRLDTEADESVFNAYFADDFVNFDTLSEEERAGFIRGVCASRGITTEELFETGISANDLKTLDYDTLFRLVYTCGTRSGDSSAADESSAVTDESSGEDSSADESSESSESGTDTLPDSSSEAGNSDITDDNGGSVSSDGE